MRFRPGILLLRAVVICTLILSAQQFVTYAEDDHLATPFWKCSSGHSNPDSVFSHIALEDILDTGRTMHELLKVLEAGRPRSIRLAVLLDKPSGRQVEIHPDYVGFTVDDRWVVGYGLDSEGLFRNLPYISYMEGS